MLYSCEFVHISPTWKVKFEDYILCIHNIVHARMCIKNNHLVSSCMVYRRLNTYLLYPILITCHHEYFGHASTAGWTAPHPTGQPACPSISHCLATPEPVGPVTRIRGGGSTLVYNEPEKRSDVEQLHVAIERISSFGCGFGGWVPTCQTHTRTGCPHRFCLNICNRLAHEGLATWEEIQLTCWKNPRRAAAHWKSLRPRWPFRCPRQKPHCGRHVGSPVGIENGSPITSYHSGSATSRAH